VATFTSMQPELIAKLLLLLAVANGAPVVVKKLLGDFLSYPADGRRAFFDGRPFFGPSKTIRGIVSSIVAASACAPMLGLAWTIGFIIAAAAMAGDLFSSFIKRRMAYPSSSRALGLDQVPESLLPALVCKSVLALTVVDIILVVTLFTAGEIVLSRLLFKMHIRDEPY
jgi:hypothetical protein